MGIDLISAEESDPSIDMAKNLPLWSLPISDITTHRIHHFNRRGN
jgi:hypothetical protein